MTVASLMIGLTFFPGAPLAISSVLIFLLAYMIRGPARYPTGLDQVPDATKLGLSVASGLAEGGKERNTGRREFAVTFGRRKYYRDVDFPSSVFEDVIDAFKSRVPIKEGYTIRYSITYAENDGHTSVISPDLSHRTKCFRSKYFRCSFQAPDTQSIFLNYEKSGLDVSIDGFSELSSAEEIMSNFDKNYAASKIPLGQALKNLTVFIGHGRSRQWRDLKDHLSDHHGIRVEAYETGARAGFTIQEVLEDLSSKASLALLVHTGEDIDLDGRLHARENVIHETGLFQSKLGFKRAIILLEDGTNEFSNIAGLQQIRFKKDNIKEIFGDVLAIIRREFSGR